MTTPNINKPVDPRFSCGPTKKPDGWSLEKINNIFLGRYHRSEDVRDFIENQLKRLKKILKIPDEFKVFVIPGSCTGAVEAVIWSLLGKRQITALIYDYWGMTWYKDLKKLNYKIDFRVSLDGSIPNLDNIPIKNDIFFVWTGTTTGISINNLEFLNPKHDGLVVSDITSAAFIYDIPWEKIDASIFSWQKALGSESQHGIVIMSPKAISRLEKKIVPKLFDFIEYDFLINTPSLLTFSDFKLCLDLYEKKGGLDGNLECCKANKLVMDKWEEQSIYVQRFVKDKSFQALSPFYATFTKSFDYEEFFNYLSNNKIALDIRNYRMAQPGIRVWTGPTIKKNDLIALTNWLDWTFNKFVNK